MFWSVIGAIALFLGLLGGLECGRALGKYYRKKLGTTDDRDDSGTGSSAAEGVVYAVLGLIIAFTFAAAASRFDERRRLIVHQANALGTAWLRLDVLKAEDQPAIRETMKKWVHIAADSARLSEDGEMRKHAFAEANQLQSDCWRLTVAAIEHRQLPLLSGFVLPPQNDWIDLSTTRGAMDHLGPPPMVLQTLVILSLIASLLAGFNMSHSRERSTLHMLAFAGVISFSIYVILDLNEPRAGLIRIDASDQTMIDLSHSFDAQTTGPDRK